MFPVEGTGCILQWLSVPLHAGHFLLRVPVLKKVSAIGLAIGTKRLVAFIMTDLGSFTLAHTICSLNEDGFALAAIDAGFADLMSGSLTSNQHGRG